LKGGPAVTLRILEIFGACLLLVGCVPTQRETLLVVQRDVPTKPSFEVIPANYSQDEVEFANMVEAYILAAGVKVTDRPATKEVSLKKEAGEAEENVENAKAKGTTVEEKYFAYEDTDADYVVFTYATTRRVRITKKETREVLSSFALLRVGYVGETDQTTIDKAVKAIVTPAK
jgi:hypothetical protein